MTKLNDSQRALAYREKCTEVKRLRDALIDIAELQNNDQGADIARKALMR